MVEVIACSGSSIKMSNRFFNLIYPDSRCCCLVNLPSRHFKQPKFLSQLNLKGISTSDCSHFFPNPLISKVILSFKFFSLSLRTMHIKKQMFQKCSRSIKAFLRIFLLAFAEDTSTIWYQRCLLCIKYYLLCIKSSFSKNMWSFHYRWLHELLPSASPYLLKIQD